MLNTTIWLPYCGAAPVPEELLARWNLDPVLLAALAAAAIAFRSRFLAGSTGRPLAFGAALALLLLLFVSPFCALTSALFSARVVHHVILTAVAAPLLLLSAARRPVPLRGSLALWTGLAALLFWAWHSPPLYAWALSRDAAYWLMQVSLFGSALGFWAAIRRASAPAAVAALLATMVQMGLLGALITFAPEPLYAPHLGSTVAWGLTPLDDQQLAGLIMWAPSAALYLGAALLIFARWFRNEGPAAAAA